MNDNFKKASLGKIPADIVLKNGFVLDVYTKSIKKADVAIVGDTIVGVGDYDGKKNIDCEGKFIVPGFIDAHLHIESTMSTPTTLESTLAPLGTTTLIADPHEVANVSGTKAIQVFLDMAEFLNINLYLTLPSCVPAISSEHSGATLLAEDLKPFLDNPKVLGLGEVMDIPSVLNSESSIMEKLNLSKNMIIDGHAPGLIGKQLAAYRLSGVMTDHESTTIEEVCEKLSMGFFINIREGSAARNLENIVNGILERKLPTNKFGFCSDDKHLTDILDEGHINHNVKKAIKLGMDPIDAYTIASINSAEFYGLPNLGAIAPGKQADLLILDDLKEVSILQTWCKGKVLFDKETGFNISIDDKTKSLLNSKYDELKNTVKLPALSPSSFDLKVGSEPYAVIEVVENEILTKKLMRHLPKKNGLFVPDGNINKLVVIERHGKHGTIGVGAIKGFPVNGAIASTVAHDSHNLIVIGDNDEDMILASKELEKCGGGYAIASKGKILYTIALPICGLICDLDSKQLNDKISKSLEAAYSIGVSKNFDPFTTLSFLALPVLPEIRLTDQGYVTF